MKEETLEVIRPELNLEKWPAIWQPSSKSTPNPQIILERTVTLQNGDKVKATVHIGSTQLGVLTTEDQKVYYALQKLWEKVGKPSERVPLSLRQLATLLNRKWGTNVIRALTDSLLRLRITPIFWFNSYFNSVTGKRVEKLNDPFTILSELEIYRGAVGSINQAVGYFRFHPLIETNLLNGYTKPLLYPVVVNFKSEIAQILYGYLDLILANKTHFERRTQDLFEDLHLSGKEYRYVSTRVRSLTRVLAELQKKELSSGGYLEVKLEKTKDQQDFKLVAKKVSPHNSVSSSEQQYPDESETESPNLQPEYLETMTPNDLVTLFLSTFQIRRKKARPQELFEAKRLIDALGLTSETGKKFIEYSLTTCKESKLTPKHFNEIIQHGENFLKVTNSDQPQLSVTGPNLQLEMNGVLDEIEEMEFLEKNGDELLRKLSPSELKLFIDEEYKKLRKSEKWHVFERWTEATLQEHLLYLVKKRVLKSKNLKKEHR